MMSCVCVCVCVLVGGGVEWCLKAVAFLEGAIRYFNFERFTGKFVLIIWFNHRNCKIQHGP